jgi:ABC-2 type transport system permease protein
MRYAISIYRSLISIQIRSQMQYRLSFLMEVITSGLASFTAFLALALTLQKFDNVGGWRLGEVAFLYGLVETSFGVTEVLFSGFDPQSFGQQVSRGLFDQLLLRPAGLIVQVIGSQFVLRRLGRIFQGMAVFTIALGLLQIHWTPAKLIYLPLVFAGQVCFFGGLYLFGAALTFWTVQSVEVVNIFTYGGTEMMAYPMHIYPATLRRFFTFVVPAIFLNYYPTLYFLGKSDPLGLPLFTAYLAPAAGLVVLAAGLGFWNYGLKHYQSTGT